jgi:hypothetical protein
LSDEACIEKKNYCEKAGCQKLFTAKCNNDAKTNETIEQFYELDQQDRKDNLTGTDFSRMLAKYTGYRIKAAGAILGATSLESIAICTAARLNYTEYWKDPRYIECDDYDYEK